MFDLWWEYTESEPGNQTSFGIFDRRAYSVFVYEYLSDREVLFRFLQKLESGCLFRTDEPDENITLAKSIEYVLWTAGSSGIGVDSGTGP